MSKWMITFLIATAAIAGASGCSDGQSPTAPTGIALDPALSAMLARAIQDEYRAETIYQGVLNDFGPVQPFANVLTAEERHSAAVARLYLARGLAAPTNQLTVAAVPHFGSVVTACDAGVTAERENIAMYDEFLQADLPADVRQVFTNNRNASLLNHMPAFERCL